MSIKINGQNVGVNSPLACKKQSAILQYQLGVDDYFTRFTSESANSIIQIKKELAAESGTELEFDLLMKASGTGVDGDTIVEGTGDTLTFMQDRIKIDQHRKAFQPGGKMSQKRTIHDLRDLCRWQARRYFKEWNEQLRFVYLSGARGHNPNPGSFVLPLDFNGFAENAIRAPDKDHLVYGGSAVSKATLTASDKMSRALIERVKVLGETLMDRHPDNCNLTPVSVDGNDHYVLLMNKHQEHDLRQESGVQGWAELHKAALAANGSNNLHFKGGLGMINNVVLHSHNFGIVFNDYGAGQNVRAARALLLGAQAGIEAAGSKNGATHVFWSEKKFDHDNQIEVMAGMIKGFSKTRYGGEGGRDYGVVAVDTAAADPNPVL